MQCTGKPSAPLFRVLTAEPSLTDTRVRGGAAGVSWGLQAGPSWGLQAGPSWPGASYSHSRHVGPPSKRLGVGDFHPNSLTKEAGTGPFDIICPHTSGNQAFVIEGVVEVSLSHTQTEAGG